MKTQKNTYNNSPIIEHNFSGPGIKRAVQESVKTKTNVMFIYDRDQMGNIIRVGYFLTSREINKQVSPIQWFKNEEIEIKTQKSLLGIPNTGQLDVKFIHNKKTEKHFSVLLPIKKTDIRLRCIFRIERDSAKTFIIMLDKKILLKGKYSWKSVVRYDCAHGFLHKDVLNQSGEKVERKERLITQNKSEAITFIINELLSDLKHLGILMDKNSDGNLKVSALLAVTEIRKTEEVMKDLFNSPELFDQIESTMTVFSEGTSSIIK